MEKRDSRKLQIGQTRIRWPLWGENLVHETFVYYLHLINQLQSQSLSDWEWSPPNCAEFIGWDSPSGKSFLSGAWIYRYPWLARWLILSKLAQPACFFAEKHVSKIYRAQVDGIMDETDVARFWAGIALKISRLACEIADLRGGWGQRSSYVEIMCWKENSIRSSAWSACSGSGGFRADLDGSSQL